MSVLVFKRHSLILPLTSAETRRVFNESNDIPHRDAECAVAYGDDLIRLPGFFVENFTGLSSIEIKFKKNRKKKKISSYRMNLDEVQIAY